MGNVLLNLEFDDNEILKAVEDIRETADELRRKASDFQLLLKAKVPFENPDGK